MINLITILSIDINDLEDLKGTDANENALAFDAWEEIETIGTRRNVVHQLVEKGNDFHLLREGPASFENFKPSSVHSQVQHNAGDTTKYPFPNITPNYSPSPQYSKLTPVESFRKCSKGALPLSTL